MAIGDTNTNNSNQGKLYENTYYPRIRIRNAESKLSLNTSFRSGLSFGLAGEQNLLYHLPEKLFDSFSGKLLLTGEKNASAHCRIINNGTPVQEFRLDGNTTPKTLTISTPAGEFGLRLTSTAPYGIVVLGDAQFCAGRFDSGAISNGSDGRDSGGASRKSQKNEAAS